MYLRDPKKLAKLMVLQEISQREMAKAAGWRSHSYMRRLLTGEAKTLRTEPALLIAHTLGVPVDDLFVTRLDTIPGGAVRPSRPRRSAA